MITITNTGVGAYLDGAAFIKMLIMGEPGAGKTRSASFWPKPIYANCERKSMSLLDRNVQSVQIGTLAQMEELLLLLRSEGQKPPQDRRWQTFVIDTFDAYQRTLINERLTKERREKFINDDWNWLGTKISQFLERVANLPMHVVINLHVKDVTEGEGDDRVVKSKPHLKGDVRDQIAAEFDLVGFMESYWSVEAVEGKAGERQKILRRRIQWTQDERHPVLKDCSGQLGTYTDVDFTEEDFNRIWLPIIGRLDDLPESTQQDVQVPGAQQAQAEPVGPMEGGPVATPDQAVAAAAPPAKAPLKTPTPAKKAAAKKAAPTKAAASPAAPFLAPSTPESSSGSTTEASSETAGASSAPAPSPAGGEPEAVPAAAPSPPAGTNESAGTATPVAVPHPSDDTAADAASADDVAQAQSALTDGGVQTQVVSETPTADPTPQPAPEPAATASNAVRCGDGEGPFQGCGKELPTVGPERDKAELAYVRWRNRLCAEDFQRAKNNQLPRKTA